MSTLVPFALYLKQELLLQAEQTQQRGILSSTIKKLSSKDGKLQELMRMWSHRIFSFYFNCRRTCQGNVSLMGMREQTHLLPL